MELKMEKQEMMTEENMLVADTSKPRRHSRLDASKLWLTTLLYLVPLDKIMNYIIPFYWQQPKRILDVTAGDRIIWRKFPYNNKDISTNKVGWRVDFADISEDAKADIFADARKIHKHVKHTYEIGVADFPFIPLDYAMESFGTVTRQQHRKFHRLSEIGGKKKLRREFYFRYFVPPEILFKQCVYAFNKVFTDGLIIKMGDSHKNHVYIPNHLFAILSFDHRFNPRSKFYLVDIIHYRGNYAKRGAKVNFAQPVVTYYLIFKKDPTARYQ